jgi:chemotaxis protein methyltransferase CheR
LGDHKEYLLENRLSKLLTESGCKTYKEFYLKAKNEPQSGLRDKIVDAMTTNETTWFRDTYPFDILKQRIFPQFNQEALQGKRLSMRIWSAACSTGQEPYSTAMTLMEFAKGEKAYKLSRSDIIATDISPSAIFLATSGNYDDFAMERGLPPMYKNQYFEKKGRFWSVKDDVKRQIKFKIFNLQDTFASLGKFDIIFCRNVAIYFSAQLKKALFTKVANALNPGGYFFLGGSESITGFSDQFEMLKHKNGVYYRVMNTKGW